MKHCTECGAAIADDAAFCPNCGSKAEQAGPNPNPNPNQGGYNSNPNPNPDFNQPGGYGAPQGFPGGRNAIKLKANRSYVAFLLLPLITLGIYALYVMSEISVSINTIAEMYDRKKTMHFCLVVFVFSWLTLGIVPLVWFHRISARIGDELNRRGIRYNFGAGTFWGWGFFGTLILVGPFIYFYRLIKSMNLLSEDYNRLGC